MELDNNNGITDRLRSRVKKDAAQLQLAPTVPLGIPNVSPAAAVRLKEQQGIAEALLEAGHTISAEQLHWALGVAIHAVADGRLAEGQQQLQKADLPEAAAQLILSEVQGSTLLKLLPEKKRPMQDDIRDALAMQWVIYYDGGTRQYYYGPVGNDDPFALQPFDRQSEFLNEVLGDLQRVGIDTDSRRLQEAVFNKNCYTSVSCLAAELDYLAARWDGTDYIAELLKTVRTDADPLFAENFKRWGVNAVAQAYGDTEKHRNDCAFVLVSHTQGIGKTAFFEGLLWNNKWLASVPDFGFDNKEHRLMMSSKFLILLDELGQYKRADVETLKAGMSQTKITADAKYKSTADYARNASFAGCSNDDNFLKDDTGDRRFLVFRLKALDRPSYLRIDKRQLWGQFASLYKKRFDYHMTPEQTLALVERNSDNFTISKPEDAFIEERLEITNSAEDFISSTEMQRLLDDHRVWARVQSFLNINVVRAKLQKRGVDTSVKKRIGDWQGRGYAGVRRKRTVP